MVMWRWPSTAYPDARPYPLNPGNSNELIHHTHCEVVGEGDSLRVLDEDRMPRKALCSDCLRSASQKRMSRKGEQPIRANPGRLAE